MDPSQPVQRPKRSLLTGLRAISGLGILAYLTRSGAIEWSVLGALAARWPGTLVALGLLIAALLATSWRLSILLKPHRLYLPLRASLRLTLLGAFFNSLMPGALSSDAVRIYYGTTGIRGRRTEIATLVLFERAIGLFTLLLWLLGVAWWFAGLFRTAPMLRSLMWLAAGLAATMVTVALICTAMARYPLLIRLCRKLPFGNYGQRILETLQVYRYHAGTLCASVAISLLMHTLNTAVMLALVHVLNPGSMRWEMGLLIQLGFLINALPLTPGGLGVGEVAFHQLFVLAGFSRGAETLIGWRILTTLSALFGLVFYIQGRKRLIAVSPLPPATMRSARSAQE